MTNTVPARSDWDVVVVGAGFAGMYLLHKLRPLGFSVRVTLPTLIPGTSVMVPSANAGIESVATMTVRIAGADFMDFLNLVTVVDGSGDSAAGDWQVVNERPEYPARRTPGTS